MMIIAISIVLFLVVGCAAIFVDRSRSETARLRMLVELSERLQLSTTIEDAIRELPSFVGRLFPRLEGALFMNRNGVLRPATTWSNTREEDGIVTQGCSALRNGTTYLAARCGNTVCEQSMMNAGKGTVCVPMLDAGEPLGLMTLRAPGGILPAETERLATPFAHQVARALSNLRLQETLRAAAVRDSLTGLYNRRCITESLTLELLSGGDPNARTGVILLDVDHFKRFNDTWGHGGGDALLRQLATLMQDVFSGADDIVCRYGGEEFVVVLPNVTPDVLRARAERLLERVRDLQINCDGHLVGGITISAGLAISPNHATDIEGLIAAADRAMYVAKNAGRDRVSAPPLQIVAHSDAA
jgi:diguanylate cyclase (GGDEF)-like protein